MTSGVDPNRGARRFLVVLVVLLALAGGAVGSVLLRSELNPLEADLEQGPQFSVIGTAASDQRTPAGLSLTWQRARTVTSGPVSGRVTAIPSVSVPVALGEPVIEVDGLDRVALAAERPLWRPLDRGTAGPDVAEVARLLNGLGHLESADHTIVGAVFAEGVRSFEENLGWPVTGVFKPEYVIWFPPGGISVGQPLVSVNDVVDPNTVLFREAPRLSGASVVPADASIPLDLPQGDLVFDILGGPTVELADEDEDVRVVSDDLLVAADHAVTVPVSEGASDPVRDLSGVVRLAQPVQVQTIPSAAVLVGPSDATCVVVESGEVVSVDVSGGRGGVTEIEPVLDPGTRVQLSPDPSLASSCG